MRLTEKDKTGYTLNEHYGTWTTGVKIAFDKLGQLEDIEDELGIDLVLIGKLLTQGFYFKDEKCNILHLSKEELKEGLLETIEDAHKYLKEYGKTWALTKEELEK